MPGPRVGVTMPSSTMLERARVRLERLGAVEVLRRRKGHHSRRFSPFGWLDLLLLAPDRPPLAVRLARSETEARRLARLLPQQPAASSWLASGCALEVWTLVNDGPRCRKRWLTIEVISVAESAPPHRDSPRAG